MSHAEKFNKASTAFFFAGFAVSKLHHTPFIVLATLSNLVSLFLYAIAYCLWFLASRLYPDYPRKAQSWYGFTEFKNQHIIAVILGIAAIISCVAALSMPLAIIPATWLFASSNSIWCISEYHKKQSLAISDKDYSVSLQTAYLRYAITTTALSFLTALDTTLAIIFPAETVLILAYSSIAGVGLGALAIYFLTDYIYHKHASDGIDISYIKMINPFNLLSEQSPQAQPRPSDEVAHFPSILATKPPVEASASQSKSMDVSKNPNACCLF